MVGVAGERPKGRVECESRMFASDCTRTLHTDSRLSLRLENTVAVLESVKVEGEMGMPEERVMAWVLSLAAERVAVVVEEEEEEEEGGEYGWQIRDSDTGDAEREGEKAQEKVILNSSAVAVASL